MAMHLTASVTLLLLVLLGVTARGGRSREDSDSHGGRSHGDSDSESGQSHEDSHSEAPHSDQTPITIEVRNSLAPDQPPQTYSTYGVFRGILVGAMRRLQETSNFSFTYTEDQNYGPFLTSVNGLYGDFSQRTYWQLQVMKPDGTLIIPDVGIGCYIPTANDKIIFNFSSY